MSSLSLVVIAVSVLLALAACWIVLMPLLREEEKPETAANALQELLFERDRLYQALEDLEHDFLSEKIAEDDYNSIKKDLLGRTAKCAADIKSLRSETDHR